MKIPSLSEVVLKSLDFFKTSKLPKFNLNDYQMPFVVGSGNALSTGKIIFSQKPAIFADESNFKSVIKSYLPIIKKKLIKQAVILSASGEKDSVWEAKLANKYNLKTTLLTCKPNSTAAKIVNKVYAFHSLTEPYTYNTSTYLGMVLSSTNEDSEKIKTLINQIKFPKNFSNYFAFAFIVPDKYLNITPMLKVKGDELFGPHLMLRACTQGHARHAKFVHPWKKELVITLNDKNKYFGHPSHRWNLNLPKSANYGTVMALTYYLVGKIQESKPAWFKKNIKNFCQDYGPKAYGKKQVFEVMVPGN